MRVPCHQRWRLARTGLGVLICLSLGVTSTLARADSPEIDPRDPHRLVMGGEPWLPVGYTPGLGAFTVRRDRVSLEKYSRAYHAWLEDRGLNFYRAVFSFGQAFRGEKTEEALPYQRVVAERGSESEVFDLDRFDLDRFDPRHFEYWRGVIEDAAARGVVVQLSLFDSWHLNEVEHGGGWGRRFDFYYGDNNVNGVTFDLTSEAGWHEASPSSAVYQRQKLLVDKVVAELGSLPNLIWEICNEPGEYSESWAKPLARYLRQKDRGRHLVIPIDLPDHQHTPGHQRPDHEANAAHGSLVKAFARRKPLLSHNDSVRGFLSAVGQRKKGWGALTAGAHINYFFNLEGMKDLAPGLPADRGARFLGHILRFVDVLQVDLSGMRPCDDLVSGSLTNSSWCLARPGQEYVIYKRKLKQNIFVTVAGLPNAHEARWFDPREGRGYLSPAPGEVVEKGLRFTPPNRRENDWVLHIRMKPSGPEAPSPQNPD